MAALTAENRLALGILIVVAVFAGLGGIVGAIVPSLSAAQAAVVVGAFVLILSSLSTAADGFSVPFWLSAIAVLSLGSLITPDWLIAPFAAVVGLVVGGTTDQLAGFAVVPFAVGLLLVMIAVLAVRNAQKYSRTETIAKNTVGDIQGIIEEYVTIGRLVVTSLLSLLVFVLAQGGDVLGVLGDQIAQAPLIAANALTVLLGYLTLGGTLPQLGTLPAVSEITPLGWVIVAGGLFVAALAFREADTT